MTKYNIVVTSLLIVIVFFFWFETNRLHKQLDKEKQTNIALSMKGDLALGRANTSFVAPSVKILDSKIQNDIASRDAIVNTITEIRTKYISTGEGQLISNVEKCSTASFLFQDFRLHAEGDAVKKTFQYKLTQRFEVITAETKLPNGGINNYAELYELDIHDKRIGRMDLTKFDVQKSPPDPKHFSWWDPYLDLSVGGLINNQLSPAAFANIGVSFMSFGRSKDLDLRLIRLAIGIDQFGTQLSFSPIQYNFARPIPLINNLWLTPQLGYTIDIQKYFLGLGIAATL